MTHSKDSQQHKKAAPCHNKQPDEGLDEVASYQDESWEREAGLRQISWEVIVLTGFCVRVCLFVDM
jgi:hypothetical protein